MQRKYNMALQHFYEAATHSATDEEEMKTKLRDLSGSEEDVFEAIEKQSKQYHEVKETNMDTNENNYFTYEKEMSVKRVKPVSICSWRGSILLCIWCILFVLGVLSISYCLQIAINRIPDKTYISRLKHNGSIPIVKDDGNHNYTEPCNDFKIEKVWSNKFHKFRASSSLRLVDVDKDGVDDVLYGFSTSLDGPPNMHAYKDLSKAKEVCEKYFDDIYPCFGGVVALSGTSGKKLWIHYSNHGITSVICNGDLNNDGYADCLCSGHGDIFKAINGKTGEVIWKFHVSNGTKATFDFSTPQFINDVDGDGVLDILQFHGGHAKTDRMGKVLFVSGKTGTILKSHDLVEDGDTHSSPVVYLGKNNAAMVIYGTGDANNGGHLFVISLQNLYDGKLNESLKILSNQKKGFMNAPNLVDVNGDSTVDIINAGFGDKIQAVDGITFKILWTYHSSNTETYSIPGVGYYNDDDTADFFVRVNTGSGFPVYYDSKVLILNGKTGLPFEKAYKTSVPTHTSPLSVSMEGSGNDLFLYWAIDCVGHEHEGGWYNFVQGTDIADSILSDSCFARFGTRSFVKFYVTNKEIGFPGKPLYFSDDDDENSNPTNKKVTIMLRTGAVTPSLSGIRKNDNLVNTFDVVFVTSHITPTHVRVITPSDVDCIKDYKERITNNTIDIQYNHKNGIYDEGDTATNYCLSRRLNGKTFDDPMSAKKKNFNNGDLVVHRYQLTCLCEKGKYPVRVLPRREQGWSQYMGSLSNGYFNRRPDGRFLKKKE